MINDFVEYWAAAKLLLASGNPYSPTELLSMERSVGWSKSVALVMWNPPWTLPLILPLGMLDYDTAQLIWFLLHSLIIFVGAQILWQFYDSGTKKARYRLLPVLIFPPVYFALLLGQIGPMILLGIIGLVCFAQRKSWFCAGASLSLVSIKPHISYLLWIAAILWVLREKIWRLALGAGIAILLLVLTPLWWNAAIYTQYAELLSSHAVVQPTEWATPTLGTALGVLLGDPNGPIRWLPSAVGALWLIWHWSVHRAAWSWIVETPLLLLVSVTTASFAWTFDHVILLSAVVQCAVWMASETFSRLQRLVMICVYLIFAAVLILGKTISINDFWYFWFAPMLLVFYLHVRRQVRIECP
ncbi:MAG TPA: glycosyltransferase family 87 protein [Candidatus Binatia bacterium]